MNKTRRILSYKRMMKNPQKERNKQNPKRMMSSHKVKRKKLQAIKMKSRLKKLLMRR